MEHVLDMFTAQREFSYFSFENYIVTTVYQNIKDLYTCTKKHLHEQIRAEELPLSFATIQSWVFSLCVYNLNQWLGTIFITVGYTGCSHFVEGCSKNQ